jgi:hypothetical protein
MLKTILLIPAGIFVIAVVAVAKGLDKIPSIGWWIIGGLIALRLLILCP